MNSQTLRALPDRGQTLSWDPGVGSVTMHDLPRTREHVQLRLALSQQQGEVVVQHLRRSQQVASTSEVRLRGASSQQV